jgi:multiple sugar transport system permease protein
VPGAAPAQDEGWPLAGVVGRQGPPARGAVTWLRSLPTSGYSYVGPALAVLVVMNLLPMIWSFGLSFYRFRADRPHTPPRFIGLGNYIDAILSDDTWERAQHTAVLMVASVTVQIVVGSLLALAFHRPFPGRRAILMLVMTPMLLSTVAVGTFFQFFYDPTFGFVSALVRGLTGEGFVPLATPASAMFSLIIADAWMWSPFVMLMLLAGLQGVPAVLAEAAEIDRASGWRRFRSVVFPSIRGVLLLAVLFRMIESFNQFDLIYTITNGGPGSSTETLSTEIYDTAFVLFETGRASALTTFGTFIIIVLVRLYFQALRQSRLHHA